MFGYAGRTMKAEIDDLSAKNRSDSLLKEFDKSSRRARALDATRAKFPKTLPLEEAAKLAFSTLAPTPSEVVAWCDGYHAIIQKRATDARAFYDAELKKLEDMGE